MTIKTQRLLDRARKLGKKGNSEEAKKLYASILKDSPLNLEAKNALLLIEKFKGEERAPKKVLQSVIALYSNGHAQEALNKIEALVKIFPKEPILYNISGGCYQSIGQLNNAVKSFEKALRE